MRLITLILLVCMRTRAGAVYTSVAGGISQLGGPISVRCVNAGSDNAACSDSGSQASLSLQANADFGDLSATASAVAPVGLFDFGMKIYSAFLDTLTINTPGVPQGFVQYHFQLALRDLDQSGNGGRVFVSQDNQIIAILEETGGFPIGFDSSLAQFTSGVEFSLQANASVQSIFKPGLPGPFVIVDSLSFKLTGISVFDQNQNPLTGAFTVTSPSSSYGGLVSFEGESAIPEPSSAKLLMFGLSLIAAWPLKSRLRRSAHPMQLHQIRRAGPPHRLARYKHDLIPHA